MSNVYRPTLGARNRACEGRVDTEQTRCEMAESVEREAIDMFKVCQGQDSVQWAIEK